MKKLGLIFKETSEKEIKTRLKNANSVFVVRYSGLSSPDITALRQSLKKNNADMLVAKNSVTRRAFKDSGFESLIALVVGPCGIVFAREEPVAASKALWDFAKAHENLKLEGGALKDKILAKNDIESLARLPSKEVLRAQAVMTLKSPITGFVMVLNQTLRKFVYCLDQIKKRKDAK
ncbi:50S ribosomal protein L10 [bacterium]|nr:MAG: 50S ribosomal protein L10 [bacterium]